MTEKKQFNLHTDLAKNCFIVGNDCKFGMFDKLDRKQCLRVIDKLNEQDAEIKQLKQIMQEVAEILSEEVDLFSDEATKHDINAYMELKELDNKDAYYMAIATKKAIKMLKGNVE